VTRAAVALAWSALEILIFGSSGSALATAAKTSAAVAATAALRNIPRRRPAHELLHHRLLERHELVGLERGRDDVQRELEAPLAEEHEVAHDLRVVSVHVERDRRPVRRADGSDLREVELLNVDLDDLAVARRLQLVREAVAQLRAHRAREVGRDRLGTLE